MQPNPPTRGWRNAPIEGTEDWYEVTGVYDLIEYEWNELLAWYSPSERRYFWIHEGGCSCDSIDMYMESKSDFESGSRADLVRAVRNFCDNAYDLPANEKADAVASVMRFKEPTK